MKILTNIKKKPILLIYWLPRALGVFLTILLAMLTFGQGVPDFSSLSQKEIIMFICLALMLLGLLFGFKWDGPGSFLILFGFTFFVVLEGGLPGGWVFLLILLTGILYLLSFILIPRKKSRSKQDG